MHKIKPVTILNQIVIIKLISFKPIISLVYRFNQIWISPWNKIPNVTVQYRAEWFHEINPLYNSLRVSWQCSQTGTIYIVAKNPTWFTFKFCKLWGGGGPNLTYIIFGFQMENSNTFCKSYWLIIILNNSLYMICMYTYALAINSHASLLVSSAF